MITFDKGNIWQLQEILKLYKKTIDHMNEEGIEQWTWGEYPNAEIITEDLSEGYSFLIFDDATLIGAFALNQVSEKQYNSIPWRFGNSPIMLHRLVLDPEYQGRGIGKDIINLAMHLARSTGYDSLRLDTYSKNYKALKLYKSLGFFYSGEVYFDEKTDAFMCFELPLIKDCPLLPIPMEPVFRYGSSTPWGGEKLRSLFNKETPDNHTGESIEVSAIEGLSSKSVHGLSLNELVNEHKEQILGTGIDSPFPLLIKLIDAKESLSLQVHPDDFYAKNDDGATFGKTEAWVILQASPESQIVYGFAPGITKAKLRQSVEKGDNIEKYMNKIPVRAGDVFHIPAGVAHCIGKGIVLYEIQQASNLTYRIYDWDRVNDEGMSRKLDIDKAMDVIDMNISNNDFDIQNIYSHDDKAMMTLINNSYFVLQRVNIAGDFIFKKDSERFRILTALDDMSIQTSSFQYNVSTGETILIPASCPDLTIKGFGKILLAYPTI